MFVFFKKKKWVFICPCFLFKIFVKSLGLFEWKNNFNLKNHFSLIDLIISKIWWIITKVFSFNQKITYLKKEKKLIEFICKLVFAILVFFSEKILSKKNEWSSLFGRKEKKNPFQKQIKFYFLFFFFCSFFKKEHDSGKMIQQIIKEL